MRGKYRIPFYMSTDCENLLKKFLVLSPMKRHSLEVSFINYDVPLPPLAEFVSLQTLLVGVGV